MSTVLDINSDDFGSIQLDCYDPERELKPLEGEMAKIRGYRMFKYHKWILAKLRIYQAQPQNEINIFLKSFSFYYEVILTIAFDTSNIVFQIQHISQDFSVALRACIFLTANTQAMFMFLFYGINVTKIRDMHIKLQRIIDECIESKFLALINTSNSSS